ncbi:hypothetical protein AAF712_016415, partial [Marasmius tenuissimus]
SRRNEILMGYSSVSNIVDCAAALHTLEKGALVAAFNKDVTTDVLIPWDRFRLVKGFLQKKNFRCVEYVRDEKTTAARSVYAHGRLPKVSVTAVPTKNFWLPFLKFQGSMSANLVSATTVFTMYPELTFNRLNLMRNTALCLVAEHNVDHTRAQRLGFDLFRHNGLKGSQGC